MLRISEREDSLLSTALLFVSSSTTKCHVKFMVAFVAQIGNAQVVWLVASAFPESVRPHSGVVCGNYGAISDTAVYT